MIVNTQWTKKYFSTLHRINVISSIHYYWVQYNFVVYYASSRSPDFLEIIESHYLKLNQNDNSYEDWSPLVFSNVRGLQYFVTFCRELLLN